MSNNKLLKIHVQKHRLRTQHLEDLETQESNLSYFSDDRFIGKLIKQFYAETRPQYEWYIDFDEINVSLLETDYENFLSWIETINIDCDIYLELGYSHHEIFEGNYYENI